MGSRSILRAILAVLVLIATLVAPSGRADDDADIPGLEGHHLGFIAGPIGPFRVEVDVKKVTPHEFDLDIPDVFNLERLVLRLEVRSQKELRLSSVRPEDFLVGPVILEKVKGNCFAGGPLKDDRICFDFTNSNTIALFLASAIKSDFLTHVPTKPVHELPPKEKPLIYTVEQLMERAGARSFESLEEFEKVLQAKLTALNAKQNLLPHENINTQLALSLGSPQAMVGAIGTLAPFFLPNRWFQAANLDELARAEQNAFQILQATVMYQVQQLALLILRDEAVIESLQENRLSIMAVRDQLITSEQATGSDFQVGTSDEINIVLQAISRMIYVQEQAVAEQRLALSQATGFINPQAVDGIVPVKVPPVTGPIAGPPEAWEKTAIERSVQLTQLDHLIEAARLSLDSRYVQWLDPEGDEAGSLGPGYVSYVEIGKSKVRELIVRKAEAESKILKAIDLALTRSVFVFKDYRNAVESSLIDQRRIARLTLNFSTGNLGISTSFIFFNMAAAYEDKVLNDVYQIDGLYSQLALASELEFLTYTGPYAPKD